MKPTDHFMGHPGLHGHCEPAPPMHPHCTPCPPAPPMHPHCHPVPMPLCHDINALDYARLHELVMKIYRFCTSLKERVDAIDPEGIGDGGNNGGTGSTGGTGVKSIFKQVYIQSKNKPNRPNGGEYNFITNTFTVPSGWSASTEGFNDENTTWMSYNSFLSDGTNAGWSDPIELIDYAALFDKLDKELADMYDKMLADAIERLDGVQADAVEELINGNKTLAQAKKDIEAARAEIEKAQGALEGVVSKVNKLDGKIQFITDTDEETLTKIMMLADYLNGTDGTVTQIVADIDFLKGELGAHATQIQTNEGRINDVDARMSAAESNIGLHAQSIDTINEKVTQAGIDINGINATVVQLASQIDAANNNIGEVRTELNGTTAKATTAAKWVDENEQKVNKAYTNIDGLNSRVTVASSTANTAKNTADAAKLEVDALNKNITATVDQRIDNAVSTGKISVTPEKITAALTNNQGAAAAIVAEINKSGSSVQIDADKILLNGQVIARLLGTERLVINGGKSVFEPDGSGYVANGNIRWDKYGHPTIGDNAIELNSDGSLKDLNFKARFKFDDVVWTNEVPGPYYGERAFASYDNRIYTSFGYTNAEFETASYVRYNISHSFHSFQGFNSIVKCGNTLYGFARCFKTEEAYSTARCTICVFKSTDGVNWNYHLDLETLSEVNSTPSTTTSMVACIGNTIVVLVFKNNVAYCSYYSSNGGASWSSGRKLQVVRVVKDIFVGFYEDATIDGDAYVSRNGKDWTLIAGGEGTRYNSAVYFNNKYYIFGYHTVTNYGNQVIEGAVWYSTDGTNFEYDVYNTFTRKRIIDSLATEDVPGVFEHCFVKDNVFYCMHCSLPYTEVAGGDYNDMGTPYYTKDGIHWKQGRTKYGARGRNTTLISETEKYVYYKAHGTALMKTEGLTNVSLLEVLDSQIR